MPLVFDQHAVAVSGAFYTAAAAASGRSGAIYTTYTTNAQANSASIANEVSADFDGKIYARALI